MRRTYEMMNTFKKAALASVVIGTVSVANAEILTSIKPLGFIASAVADGVTQTDVLVPAGASPHDYSLKPSDAKKLQDAELVLWIGEDIDSFLTKRIGGLDKHKVVTIKDIAGLKPLLGEAAEHHHEHQMSDDEHMHEHDHSDKHEHAHEHDHGDKHEHAHEHDHSDKHEHEHDHSGEHEHDHNGLETNWHIWFSPEISQLVAQQLADKLTQLYPQKSELIAKNLHDFKQNVSEQSAKINAQLASVKQKGFYVFHDAYGYFVDAYGLNQVGYFTINPLVAPGAKTLALIKEEIAEHKVQCLFAEPQFTPKVIETLSKNADVNVGKLDPMGDSVSLGKKAYANFLQSMANSFSQCLSK